MFLSFNLQAQTSSPYGKNIWAKFEPSHCSFRNRSANWKTGKLAPVSQFWQIESFLFPSRKTYRDSTSPSLYPSIARKQFVVLFWHQACCKFIQSNCFSIFCIAISIPFCDSKMKRGKIENEKLINLVCLNPMLWKKS